jgi:homoserine kinase type II
VTQTGLNDAQARQILRHYCLDLRGIWQLPRGTINSNYLVETDAGPLFLQICEGKSVADVEFLSSFMWHLCSHAVHTPPPWRTRTGAAYLVLPRSFFESGPRGAPACEKPVMLMSWVSGVEHTDTELGEAEARYVGEQLARLHLGAASFPGQRVGIYTLHHIQERIKKLGADPRAQTELGTLPDELLAEAAHLSQARRRELPMVLGHNDLFPDNLLFPKTLPRRAFAPTAQNGWILDLEQSAMLPYVYDLAVALLAFCAPAPKDPDAAEETKGEPKLGPLRQAQARALIEGYQALRALGEAEWQGFYEELRYAALRFTVTRLTDVHGYGAAAQKPSDKEAKSESGSESGRNSDGEGGTASRKLPRRVQTLTHSKDYRDFLWRWRSLLALQSCTLINGLR